MTKAARLQRIRTRRLQLSHDEIFRLDRLLCEHFEAAIKGGHSALYHMDGDILLLAAIKGALES